MNSDMRDEPKPARDQLGDQVGDVADDWVEPGDTLDDPDIELITDYLTKQLPPEQVPDVERRLREDNAFRELAAPLVLAWSVPPKWQREPMPRAELAKHWDDFTKRAGFVHQQEKKRENRRRWLWAIGIVLALFVFTPIPQELFWHFVRPLYSDDEPWRDLVPVADSGGWMTLGQTRVHLEPGAKLLKSKVPFQHTEIVKLEGSARFVYEQPPFTRSDEVRLAVLTKGAMIVTTGSAFRVSARKDTTDVEIVERPKDATRPPPSGSPVQPTIPDHVTLHGTDPLVPGISVSEGEVGRVVRGRRPVWVRQLRYEIPYGSLVIPELIDLTRR